MRRCAISRSPQDARAEYMVGELAGPTGLSPGAVRIGSSERRVAVNIDTARSGSASNDRRCISIGNRAPSRARRATGGSGGTAAGGPAIAVAVRTPAHGIQPCGRGVAGTEAWMMGEGHAELLALIARIRSRWRAVTALRVWMRAAAGAVLALGLALLTHLLVQPTAGALVALWAAAVAVAAAAMFWAVASLRRAPGNGQLARFIEERCPELEDSLVTAVAHGAVRTAADVRGGDGRRRASGATGRRGPRHQSPVRCVGQRCSQSPRPSRLPRLAAFRLPVFLQAVKVVRVHLFPETLDLRVAPGDVRVRAGESVRVVATLSGDDLVTPLLRLGARRRMA